MYNKLLQHPLIPVVEIDSPRNAPYLAEAILTGGLEIVEVTLRTATATEAIRAMRRAFPELLVGAGTVLDLEQSARARDAGAHFGLAPGLQPCIVESFHADGLPFAPGVVTPSEFETAARLACRLVKFFPAEAAGGVDYLRALGGPYRQLGVQFCATGGITLDNMLDYLRLPLVGAVGGSWLATPRQIADGEWRQISQQVARAAQVLKETEWEESA